MLENFRANVINRIVWAARGFEIETSILSLPIIFNLFIAFVKERFHNAVEIDILGIFEGYSSLQIWPPRKIFQGGNYSGRMT